MRTILTPFLFLILFVSVTFAQDAELSPLFSKSAPVQQEAMWDVLFNYNASTVTLLPGNTGAVYVPTLGKYITSRWGSALLHTWNTNGTLVDSFTVAGVTGTRNMCWNGAEVVHAVGTGVLYRVNPTTRVVVGNVTLPAGVTARFISYNPDADGGNGGYYVGNWNAGALNYILVSKTGTQLSQIANTTITGTYGIAYDKWSTGGPFLWVWSQGSGAGTPQKMIQISIATGLPTGVEHDVMTDVGVGSTDAVAGGMFITDQAIPGYVVMGGVLQGTPNRFFGYELKQIIVPVEFSAFAANTNGTSVVLDWTTATETNNRGFEIQRKSSNSDFVTIGFVAGNGTTTSEKQYTYADNNVAAGVYTYRLRQVDFDGTSAFSKTLEVNVVRPAEYALQQNFPNPFNPSTAIQFSIAADAKVSLKVFNVLGQEVTTLVNSTLSAGTHSVTFDATGLESGVYFARIDAAGIDGSSFSSVRKMVVNK